MNRELKYALGKTIPIMFSYLFLSMAFGIMMNQAGFPFYWAYLVSLTVYTGAFQFVIVSFLSAGAGIATIALTALAMNCRHMFYGVTFLKEFKSMGKRYPYMIFSLTDETYALYCSLEYPEELDHHQVMFDIAWLSRAYWLIGTLVGALLGQIIPFDFEGVDFCMTALFVTILIDQWKKTEDHAPAVIGGVSAVVFLLIFGASRFMLPSLMVTTALLLIFTPGENILKTADDRNNVSGNSAVGKTV
ncbi:AzlC family ABC transporter permease [Ventrimonas sp. CLA-AP-H27]|uniref:AzlC family ABC transporter permease n=1 Tax=Ventrimonas faecis TaxID=3133170 RepID=A0ABV1HN82_9FIRM